MPVPVPITVEEIEARLKEGQSVRRIADQTRIRPQTIYNRLHAKQYEAVIRPRKIAELSAWIEANRGDKKYKAKFEELVTLRWEAAGLSRRAINVLRNIPALTDFEVVNHGFRKLLHEPMCGLGTAIEIWRIVAKLEPPPDVIERAERNRAFRRAMRWKSRSNS